MKKRLVKIKLKVYDDMKKNKLKVIWNEDGIDILNVWENGNIEFFLLCI